MIEETHAQLWAKAEKLFQNATTMSLSYIDCDDYPICIPMEKLSCGSFDAKYSR